MKPGPSLGILMLETSFPRIPGDIGNPESFSFPVTYKLVQGASPDRVVKQGDPGLIQDFARAARELVREGVCAITTSCGFLALFQKELAASVSVPLMTSSLMQAHLAVPILKPGQKLGILTARAKSLTRRHLEGAGIQDYPLAIAGMDGFPEFASVFVEGKSVLNVEKCRGEVLEAAKGLIRENPDIGALLLECTNMPPFSRDLRQSFGLPVYDALTMAAYLYQTANPDGDLRQP